MAGKRTLEVRLGLERSRWVYLALWVLAHAFLVGLVLMEALPTLGLLGLISLPLALYVIRHLFRNYRSRAIKTAMAGTINLHLAMGLLMTLGVWLAI